MDETITEHAHIVRKLSSGEPVIKGTNTPVRGIAEFWLMGAQPEEILTHLPHLSLSQIFDALSYYNDHKEEIDRFIKVNIVPEELSGTRLSR